MKIILMFFALFCATALPALPVLDVPSAPSAPNIDGDLSDTCWRDAALIPSLSPASGAVGVADTNLQETEVRVLWTNGFLFVAFDCVDDEVLTSGTMKHDDDIYKEDVVEIFIDGIGDGRQFVEIQIAPDGTNLDLMYLFTAAITNDADGRVAGSILRHERWSFREWEMAGLETAARKTERGWSAEAAIPAAQIVKRLGEKEFKAGMEIRVQFVRYDHVPVETGSEKRRIIQQNWSPVIHGNPHNSPKLFGRVRLSAF